ncbi:MAG: AMP-binding protein [Gemmatimonadetes bacterium]|nr:AMP-binding protein [Gemmatimonadota bacterium]
MTFDAAECASLGAALDSALEAWSAETCAIESDRDQDRIRYTYADLREVAHGLSAWFREQGLSPGDRAAIILSNQSAWHVSAVAALHAGAVLVPVDFKLSGPEQVALLTHCRAPFVVVEFHLWRAMAAAAEFTGLPAKHVLVVGAPDNGELPSSGGASVVRWEDARATPPPGFQPVPRARTDIASIVYSSGTSGRAKGCQLTHDNYLEQFRALRELHPMKPGVVYLSILPTNHAIDFMVGFIGPYLCGATVVHLRTLRPEFVRSSFVKYRVTHVALVPLVLRNLRTGLEQRFAELSPLRKIGLAVGRFLHRLLSGGRPNAALGRIVLRPVHAAFGGRLEAIFVGGAYSDPETLRFFYDLGIPVSNGYGLTESGTAVTLDRLDPPRPETVGQPLPGTEVRIGSPGEDGAGEILVRSRTVMAGYLDDPELTAETIVDGWLHTGDLGRIDPEGNLVIVGRRKNMIVTAGGKNVYPEDVEVAFASLPVEEFCLFAAHYLWPEEARDERLILVARPGEKTDPVALPDLIRNLNRRLPDYKRVEGVLLWEDEFPRTASLKVKRGVLAERVAAEADPARDLIAVP